MILKLYNQHIFPHVLNQVMQTPSLMQARGELLTQIKGSCLEIGFGTGINLPFYQQLDILYALEPSSALWQLAESRLTLAPFLVEQLQAGAENMPLSDASVDHVVSTWTMCSIAELNNALKEIHRVLKPNGIFHFVEHVLSDQKSTQRWQHALTPIQKKLADGCHLNRNIEAILQAAGFEFIEKTYFDAKGIPKIGHRMLLGRVRKIEV